MDGKALQTDDDDWIPSNLKDISSGGKKKGKAKRKKKKGKKKATIVVANADEEALIKSQDCPPAKKPVVDVAPVKLANICLTDSSDSSDDDVDLHALMRGKQTGKASMRLMRETRC